MTLLKYWQPIIAFIATALLSYGLHAFDVQRIEARHKVAVEAARAAVKVECEADKQLTTEVSNDYQNQIANLTVQLNRLKRLHNNSKCVPVTRPSEGRNATPVRGELAGTNGLSTGWLIDFAGEAEQYRLQLISCQDFISKTWAAKTK